VAVATEPRELRAGGRQPMAVLNNAFGFGGANVCLVFTAP
jgi:3-oxoacyl-(acyl-carrier-protein) synthase